MEAISRVAFGLVGLAVLIGIVWLFSNNRRRVDWKLVATGVSLQIGFAALVLLVPGGRDVFDASQAMPISTARPKRPKATFAMASTQFSPMQPAAGSVVVIVRKKRPCPLQRRIITAAASGLVNCIDPSAFAREILFTSPLNTPGTGR